MHRTRKANCLALSFALGLGTLTPALVCAQQDQTKPDQSQAQPAQPTAPTPNAQPGQANDQTRAQAATAAPMTDSTWMSTKTGAQINEEFQGHLARALATLDEISKLLGSISDRVAAQAASTPNAPVNASAAPTTPNNNAPGANDNNTPAKPGDANPPAPGDNDKKPANSGDNNETNPNPSSP